MSLYPIKTIFVTIQEFEDQGGKIKPGRKVFSDDGYPMGEILGFDENQKCYLAKSANYKSFPIGNLTKIEIEVTPIWK